MPGPQTAPVAPKKTRAGMGGPWVIPRPGQPFLCSAVLDATCMGSPFFRGRVRGDVEREPLGKRALGGHVSARIKLIDTAYGPLPMREEPELA